MCGMTEASTKLASYMAKKKLTDEAVAAAVNCSRSMVTKLRLGKAVPSMALASRFKEWSRGALITDDFQVSPARENAA